MNDDLLYFEIKMKAAMTKRDSYREKVEELRHELNEMADKLAGADIAYNTCRSQYETLKMSEEIRIYMGGA